MENPGRQLESRAPGSAVEGDSTVVAKTEGEIRAPFLVWLGNFLRIVWLTLCVCVPTIIETMFGRHHRATHDRRIRWFCVRALRYVRADLHITNPLGIKPRTGRPTIIMSNHRSHFDIPVIYTALEGSIRMLAKKELFRVPLFGQAVRVAEFVFVDRSNHERAMKAMESARERMRGGIVLWISPEGTRSRTGRLGPFKKGGFMLALQTGAEIIPVGIQGTERVLPPTDFFHLRRGQRIDIKIGEPIDASAFTIEGRDELMNLVENRIRNLIDEPLATANA